jgi:CheY-like chemotaxis protein
VEVCVLPLHDQRLAAPIHLVEGVVPLAGWQRRLEAEGEVLVKGDARLLLVDLAAGVEGLLPVDLDDPRTHVALVGLVEKRVAFLTTGPGSRRAVRAYGAATAGWQAVASGSVTLVEGGVVPLLDIEQVIALRLRQDAGEAGLGGADAGAREWSPRGAGFGAPQARTAAGPGPAPGAAPAEQRASGRIVLLVASRFRAADLEERLLQARFEVLPCATPQEAWSRLQEGPVAAVVCDNAEPTHWLRALAEVRAEQVGRFPCPVVLVATATNDAVRRLARQLGAAGVWTPPFLIDDLRAHLA